MMATRSCWSWRSPMCVATQALTWKLDTMEKLVSRSLSSGPDRAVARKGQHIFTITFSVRAHMEQEEIKRRIIELQVEHRDLDEAIDRLNDTAVDDLALRRMKKRKLQIRDSVSRLEMGLVPDIPA